MIDHVGFAVSDYARSKRFYEQALKPLGYALVTEIPAEQTEAKKPSCGFGAQGKPDFWISGEGKLDHPLHVAILTKDRATVDVFYRDALAAGGKDNGPPGLREQYRPGYYSAFVRDPDGHNIEAVCYQG